MDLIALRTRRFLVDVPFGLTFDLRTDVPGELSVEYDDASENHHTQLHMAPLATDNRPGPESASTSRLPAPERDVTPIPHTQSSRVALPPLLLIDDLPVESLHQPPPTPLIASPHALAFADLPDLESAPSSPASSVATEVIHEYVPELQASYAPLLAAHHIRVRDFAADPHAPVPTVFDPSLALYTHLRLGNRALHAQDARRLWVLGWLTAQEARAAVPAKLRSDFNLGEVAEDPTPWVALRDEEPPASFTRRQQRDLLRTRVRARYRRDPPPPPPRVLKRRHSTDCDAREVERWVPQKRRRLSPESDVGEHPEWVQLPNSKRRRAGGLAVVQALETPPASPGEEQSAGSAAPLRRTETLMQL
ncbi:hypothetical protein HWV62_20252 [Athelia sp. TMB]|nr:hypothetical protein HWV62_20252 [Athelia sp. TMB]